MKQIAIVMLFVAAVMTGQTSGAVSYQYDTLDRLVGATDSASNTANYQYDATGNLLQVASGVDADNDFVFDGDDNCPVVSNADQADCDGDGTGDLCDAASPCSTDTDGDGVVDSDDAYLNDPAASTDSDGDGFPDAWNPGMSEADSTSGLRLDAFPSDPAASLDADGDGYPDTWNAGKSEVDSTTGLSLDIFPNDVWEWADSDGDGLGDNYADPCPLDADNDADGDGICGDVDLCPAAYDPDQADVNGNGIGDACDPAFDDSDHDGMANLYDACPDDPAKGGEGINGCGVADDTAPMLGSWWFGSNSAAVGDIFSLTFYPNGTYILAQNGDPDAPESGVEYGTFAVDAGTGELSINTLYDMHPDGVGLDTVPDGFFVVSVNGNTLTFDDGVDPFDVYRVVSGSNPLVGSWWGGTNNPDLEGIETLTFYPNGTYIHGQNGVDWELPASADWEGIEYGSYAVNPDTDVLTVAVLYDQTAGDTGGFDGVGSAISVTVEGDVATFVDAVEGEAFLYYRVPAPAVSTKVIAGIKSTPSGIVSFVAEMAQEGGQYSQPGLAAKAGQYTEWGYIKTGTLSQNPDNSVDFTTSTGDTREGFADHGVIVFNGLQNTDELLSATAIASAATGLADESLDGKYFTARLTQSSSASMSALGDMVCDGAGSWSADITYSASSVGALLDATDAGAYLVDSDGFLEIYDGDSNSWMGGVKASGDLFVTANVSSSDEVGVWYAVEAGTAGSYANGRLYGSYHVSGYAVASNGVTTELSRLTFDGLGGFTIVKRYSDSAAANQSANGTGTYLVNSDGTLVITYAGKNTHGALSGDGNFLLLARIDDSTEQSIAFGVRDGSIVDGDGDGISDDIDNCPLIANLDQADIDGDGTGDLCDLDACASDAACDDGDGCTIDTCNAGTCQYVALNCNDGDACTVDSCDPVIGCQTAPITCDDGNACTTDSCDPATGCLVDANCDDGDPATVNDTCDDGGICLGEIIDSDGDGITDGIDNCPFDPADDADGDGHCADVDNCPTLANAGQSNADGDSYGDVCDVCINDIENDADGDGVCESTDNCPAVVNASQTDTDADGSGDACDVCVNDVANDADADGVCGSVDNCPAVSNDTQDDFDQDGQGDACDLDDDGDGYADTEDSLPLDASEWLDTDGDGVGNNSDTDDDSDRVVDALDYAPLDPAIGQFLEVTDTASKTFESKEPVLILWPAVNGAVTYDFVVSLAAKSWTLGKALTGTQWTWVAPLVNADIDGLSATIVAKDAAGNVLAETMTPVSFSLSVPRLVTLTSAPTAPCNVGDQLLVAWDWPYAAQTVRAGYKLDSGSKWAILTSGAPDAGPYLWTVPWVTAEKDSTIVAVQALDGSGAALSLDLSEPFMINSPLQVTAPVGGEQWVGGSTQSFNWSLDGTPPETVASIEVGFTTNGGETSKTLITLTGADAQTTGTDWTVPALKQPFSGLQFVVTLKAADGSLLGQDVSNPVDLIPSPYSSALLNGSYQLNQLGHDGDAYAAYGNLAFDGSGSGSYNYIEHTFGGSDAGTFAYSVAPDGQVTLDGQTDGYPSVDGSVLLVTDTLPIDGDGFDLHQMLMLKLGSGLDDSTLSGDYAFAQYGYQDNAAWSAAGELSFDGAGNFSFTETANTQGGLESGNELYAVASNGRLTVAGQDTGTVSQDGGLLLHTDTGLAEQSGNRSLLIGIKKSSGKTAADLDGEYVVSELGDDGTIWTTAILITFNGDGTGSYAVIADSDNTSDSGSFSYSVTDSGGVTIDGVGSGQLRADGSALVLVDADNADGDVKLMVGVKRADPAPTISLP